MSKVSGHNQYIKIYFFHFYTVTSKYEKEKIRKQFHLQMHEKE